MLHTGFIHGHIFDDNDIFNGMYVLGCMYIFICKRLFLPIWTENYNDKPVLCGNGAAKGMGEGDIEKGRRGSAEKSVSVYYMI